jgi:uncharacterized protein YcbK (DUF882 family)
MLAAVCGLSADRIVASPPGERTISFFHIHTKETLTVTYKKDGQFIPDAMKKIDWLMRDWRKNQAIRIDPETVDIIWEMYQELGSQQPIHVICGYRSPATNSMLRKTRGGQASKSQHMTGRAIDFTFPDVPIKRLRYSALVRERGGVGYYPTSGIPFIHVDTSGVRAWPRLPRQELALLFPSGRSKHRPASGGSITPYDVKAAREKNRELATQIAQFHDLRNNPKPATMVASATPPATPEPPKRGFALASLGSEGLPWSQRGNEARAVPASLSREEDVPTLSATPKAPERPARVQAKLTINTAAAKALANKERAQLAALVEKAHIDAPKLLAAPAPAVRPSKALAAAVLPQRQSQPERGTRLAALIPQEQESASVTDMSPDSLGNGWVQAPEFDEDHPEELAYRPFPLAPLLTDTPAMAPAKFNKLQHPDVAQTLETIDDMGAVLPMRFRPGAQVAQAIWAQQFEGTAVHVDALKELDESRAATGITERAVKTSTKTP